MTSTGHWILGTSLWLGKMSRAEGQRRQPGFSTRMPACGAAGWGWGRMTGGQTEGRRAGERVCRQVWGASPGLANGRPSAGHSMHSGAAHPRGTAHAAAPLPAAAAALPGGRWGPTRLHKTRQGARSGASVRRGAASKFTQPAGGPRLSARNTATATTHPTTVGCTGRFDGGQPAICGGTSLQTSSLAHPIARTALCPRAACPAAA